MEVKQLQVPTEEIERELEVLKKGIKEGYVTRKSKITRELLQIYGHLQHGGKIIDLPVTFSKTGLRKDTDLPKLAIVSARAKQCYLYKRQNGSAIFSNERKGWRQVHARGNDILTPPDIFNWKDLENDRWTTLAPFIPPRINVEICARLIPENYHILFEVQKWSRSSPPDDPILGKMLSKNLFGVIATWELTELEKKIISGRI